MNQSFLCFSNCFSLLVLFDYLLRSVFDICCIYWFGWWNERSVSWLNVYGCWQMEVPDGMIQCQPALQSLSAQTIWTLVLAQRLMTTLRNRFLSHSELLWWAPPLTTQRQNTSSLRLNIIHPCFNQTLVLLLLQQQVHCSVMHFCIKIVVLPTICCKERFSLLSPPRRLCFCQILFVCLCVSKITQKVMDGSFWNFLGMSGMSKTTSGSILGVIRKESWILDHFEVFVYIAFNGA